VSVQFEIKVVSANSSAAIKGVTSDLGGAAAATNNLNNRLSALGNIGFHVNNIRSAVSGIANDFKNAVKPGIDFNSSLTDMQAITGVNNQELQLLSGNARELAKTYGVDAANALESNKLLLSQLTPELAKAPVALDSMTRSAAILSKQLKGDTAAATEVLTTAMNQYGVSMDDPIAASQTMASMMNIMSAAAKEGSAELPQIKAALEQAGMMAKTANVPFNELNAAIQVLDKSGKKGAEGGVALRNVMTTLSQGQFLPKGTLATLQAAGIDVDKMTDKSASLSDRLAALRPIMNDTAAMTQLFGTENAAAAIALVSNTDSITELTGKITGTNTAVEIADTVMGSFSEGMARANAWLKDMGISIFNATQGFIPFMELGGGAISTVTNIAGAVQAFGILSKTQLVTSIASAITSFGTWIGTTITATAAQWGLNVAMSANPIGLVVVAVAAAIGAIVLLVKYWDDIKAAIGSFAKWIWNHHPFQWLIDLTDIIFPGFKKQMGELFDWVIDRVDALLDWVKGAWDTITSLFGSNDGAGKVPQEATKAAVEEFAKQAQNVQIPGVTIQGVANNNSPLAGYDPNAKKANSNNGTISNTASNITSGGARPTQINITIQKLQDQTVIHTTNLDMGGKEAANKILEYLLETIQGANVALAGN
jgi:TP901 family phage tail tape measure protein